MKDVIKLWFLLCLACNLASAQTSIQGVTNFQGTALGRGFAYEKSIGLVAAYSSSQGVMMPTGSTNIYSWNDMSGNGYNLNQYASANQPLYSPSYLTNNFVIIQKTGNIRLQNYSLASLFSGMNKPITIAVVANSANSGNNMIAAFGWTSASNANASIIGLRVQDAPGIASFCRSVDTNSGLATAQSTGVSQTNKFLIVLGSCDGVNGTCYANLAAGTAKVFSSGQLTLDTFNMGVLARTNNALSFGYTGAIREMLIFTNALTGAQSTNVINSMNSRLPEPCF